MNILRSLLVLIFFVTIAACQSPPDDAVPLPDASEFRVAPSSGCADPHSGSLTGTLTVAGVSRGYRVDAPATWDGTTPIPVLYTFHACGGDHTNGSWNSLYFRSNNPAWLAPGLDPYNVLVVNGDAAGTCWDVSPTANDLPYYDLLRASVEDYYCVDGERRYHAGVSSGGFAAQAFACRRDGVAAVWAGLAGMHHPSPNPYGLTPTPLPTPSDCNGPVAVMGMASTTDTLVSATTYSRPARDAWLAINGCDPGSATPYDHRVPAADAVAGAGLGTACTGQADCACSEYACTGARTVWCEFAGTGGNGHSWPTYYRDSTVNWIGRFVDEPEVGGSSSGEPSSTGTPDTSTEAGEASTADASSTTCEMVCQCI